MIELRGGQRPCFTYGALLSDLLILLVGSLVINALNESLSP